MESNLQTIATGVLAGQVAAQKRRDELVTLVGGPSATAELLGILSDPKFSAGAKAGYAMRKFPAIFPKNPRARSLYLLLTGAMPPDKATGLPKPIDYSHKVLGRWLVCSTRSVSEAVRQLARSGPLPFIAVTPGKPGKASRFTFVHDPIAFALELDAAADVTRKHRHTRRVQEQMRTKRKNLPVELEQREYAIAARKQAWGLPPAGSRLKRFMDRSASDSGREIPSGRREARQAG